MSDEAGKGDADTRVTDRQRYRDNYDDIDWGHIPAPEQPTKPNAKRP